MMLPMRRAARVLAISVLGTPVIAPIGFTALSRAEILLHGYGFACIPDVVRDVPSPSGKWIARVRHLDCDVIAKDYLTEVVLIRGNTFIPALSKDYVVLARDANYPDNVPVSLAWNGDHVLTIETPNCPSQECWTPENIREVSVLLGG